MDTSLPSLLETEVGPTPPQLGKTMTEARVDWIDDVTWSDHIKWSDDVKPRFVERLKAALPPEVAAPLRATVIGERRPSFLLPGSYLVQVEVVYHHKKKVFWCLFFDGEKDAVVEPFLDHNTSMPDVIKRVETRPGPEKPRLQCIRIDRETVRDYVLEFINNEEFITYGAMRAGLLCNDADPHFGQLDWRTPLLKREQLEVKKCLSRHGMQVDNDTEYTLRVGACMVEGDALVWREFRIFIKDNLSGLYDKYPKGKVLRAKREPQLLVMDLPDNCRAQPRASLGFPEEQFAADREGWETVPREDVSSILSDLARRITPVLDPTQVGRLSRQYLAFYHLHLLRIEPANSDDRRIEYIFDEERIAYILWKPGFALPLDSTSSPIHELNEERSQSRDGLVIQTPEDAAAYAVFFARHAWGGVGPFIVLKSRDDHAIDRLNLMDAEWNTDWFGSIDTALGAIRKPAPKRVESPGGQLKWFEVEAWVLYGSDIHKVIFKVLADGSIEMLDDEHMVSAPVKLWEPSFALPLDQALSPIHKFKEERSQSRDRLVISTPEDAAAYAVFFARHVWGNEGPFVVLESKDHQAIGRLDLTAAMLMTDQFASVDAALAAIKKPAPKRVESSGGQLKWFEVEAWVLCRAAICTAMFRVWADGKIEVTLESDVVYAQVKGHLSHPYPAYRLVKSVREPAELWPWTASELERESGESTVVRNRVLTGLRSQETLHLRHFQRCRFRGRVNLRFLASDHGLSFEECVFENGLDLSGARLKGTVSLTDCLLVQGRHHQLIDDAQPFSLDDLSADGLRIHGLGSTSGVSARRVRIDGAVELWKMMTLGGIDLTGLAAQSLLLSNTHAKENIELEQCVIEQSVDFHDVQAGKNVQTGSSVGLSGAVVTRNYVAFSEVGLAGDLFAPNLRVGTGFLLQSAAPRGNTIGGSIQLGGAEIPKLLRIQNTRVGKSIEAEGVATAELQIFRPTTAKHLTMTGLKCLGAADITGLDLSGHPPTTETRDGAVIADLATFGNKLIVAKSLTEGATIPGRLDLSGSTIGELAVSHSSFPFKPDDKKEPVERTLTVDDQKKLDDRTLTAEERDDKKLMTYGIILNRARVDKLSVFRTLPDNEKKGQYPQPIDLRFSEIKWWEFREGDESKSDDAADYLQLLEGDHHKQRHTFSSIEQNLFNRGLDDAADEVHKAMREWLRDDAANEVHKAMRETWLYAPWRWIMGEWLRDEGTAKLVPWFKNLGRSAWDWFTLSITSPSRLIYIVLIWTAFSVFGVFSNRSNIGPSEAGRIANRDWQARRVPSDAEWDWRSGVWMALRFHVPVAVFTARSAWGPANGRELKVSLPYLPEWSWGWMAVDARLSHISPEDYANLVLALHWLLWPVILALWSRKFFMRLGK